MNIEAMRRAKLAEIDARSRERAANEIIALNQKYAGKSDLTYAFEAGGKEVKGAFVTAGLDSSSGIANGYFIELLVPEPTVVNGQAYIYDSTGKKIGVSACTSNRGFENRIQLGALA